MKKCWNAKFTARPDAATIILQLEVMYAKQVSTTLYSVFNCLLDSQE